MNKQKTQPNSTELKKLFSSVFDILSSSESVELS